MTNPQGSSIRERIHRFRSSTPFIIGTVCYAVFLDGILFTVLLPIVPYELSARFGVAEDQVQYWNTILLTVFGISCTASSPLFGWWTDRSKSRKVPFVFALVVLLAGTLMIWLTKSIAMAVLSRVLQGVSATAIYVTGFAIVVDTVGAKHIAEYMGHVSIAINVGAFAGPMLGGIVYSNAGWNAVWGLSVGLICIDIILRFAMLEKDEPRSNEHSRHPSTSSDLSTEKGQNTVSVQEIDSDIESQSSPSSPDYWKHRASDATLVGESLPGHKLSMSSSSSSIEDVPQKTLKLPAMLTLFTSLRMNIALIGICIEGAIFAGFEVVLTIQIERIWNYDAMQSGLFFLPLTVPALFAPLMGRVVDRTGARWVAAGGFLLMCPALVLIRFVDHNSIGQKVLLASLLSFVGFGVTITMDSLMAEITHVVQELEISRPDLYQQGAGAYGQAYSLFNMAWSLGFIVGPLLAGLITEKHGWATMGWVLGMLSGITSVLCALCCGGFILRSRRPKS